MLTGDEQRLQGEQTFRRLTNGPVLETWHGCIARVKHLSLGECWQLCRMLGCDMDSLDRALYQHARRKKQGQQAEAAGGMACE